MGASPWQIILVIIIIFLLFPKRLSGLGSSLGKSLKDFKKSFEENKSNKDK